MTVMNSRGPTTARRRLPSRASTRRRHPPCKSWMARPGSPPAMASRRARAGGGGGGSRPAPHRPCHPRRRPPPEPDRVISAIRRRRMTARGEWPCRRRDLEPLGCLRAPPTRRRAAGSAWPGRQCPAPATAAAGGAEKGWAAARCASPADLKSWLLRARLPPLLPTGDQRITDQGSIVRESNGRKLFRLASQPCDLY